MLLLVLSFYSFFIYFFFNCFFFKVYLTFYNVLPQSFFIYFFFFFSIFIGNTSHSYMTSWLGTWHQRYYGAFFPCREDRGTTCELVGTSRVYFNHVVCSRACARTYVQRDASRHCSALRNCTFPCCDVQY